MQTFSYYIHDLYINSEIEIPEIPYLSEGIEDKPDVAVRFGKLPEHLDEIKSSGVLFEISDGHFLLKLPKVGRYLAKNGMEIIIDPNPEASDDEIRLFLLGSVLGAILHQRGYLPLHGSSVRVKNEAVVIIGNSAAGKSTLAASLDKNGFPLISDDISSVSLNSSGECIIHPGIPYIKLWKDVIEKLHPGTDLNRVRPQIEKYKVPLSLNSARQKALPIKIIVLLSTKNEEGFSVEEITGAKKLIVLRENIYRDQFLKGSDLLENHFKLLSQLSNQSKLYHITRPSIPLMIKELTELVINQVIKLEQK